MNKLFSYILVGGASALVGAISGYFICKKNIKDIIDDEVSKRVNEELYKIRARKQKNIEKESEDTPVEVDRDLYSEARDEVCKKYADSINDLNSYRVAVLTNCLVECRKEGFSEEEINTRLEIVLAEMEHPVEDDILDEDEDVEFTDEYNEPQLIMDEWSERPPTIVNIDDYKALSPTFEFLTYYYFEGDDVLIDDGEMIIDDVIGIVGDALVHFGECDEMDDDTVYVVNGKMGLAIEIVRMHCAYTNWSGWGSMYNHE